MSQARAIFQSRITVCGEIFSTFAADTYIAPYHVALVYAGLGDKDQAFVWLDRSCDARSYLMAEYLNTGSRLDKLRADPRFPALRARTGLSARTVP